MKKSNKPKKSKTQTKKVIPAELEADFTKIMEFINKIENLDLQNTDIDQLDRDTSLLKKAVEEKYKGITKEDDISLDTEE